MPMPSSEEGDRPGKGWSNGDVPPAMYPVTRQGRISLYSAHRRWINLEKSWTRIGAGHEHDFRHSTSGVGEAHDETPEQEADTVRSLIAQLCETFYNRGWATGTGGGVSIRVGGETEDRPWRVFVAPSGIQKEDMIGHDVFELDMDRNVVTPPLTPNLRQSACTPLWYVVYRNRPSAKCVIHTHSIHAQMATLLDPTESSDTLRITHLEMLKGVGHHAYDDILEIPIIDNRPSEDLLASQLETVIRKFPKCNAVLVRRHGLYVWGDSWEQAKTQCESFDYLFESAIGMKQMGMDFSRKPLTGTYRVDGTEGKEEEPAKKRARVKEDGFRGRQKVNNEEDLKSNTVPILPRDSKILLLDIEGCTTAISYVKEILFPYVLNHVNEYERKMPATQIQKVTAALMEDAKQHGISTGVGPASTQEGFVSQMVHRLMENDVKATGLKALQGQMWKAGYESGELKGHVFDDFVPLLKWCQSHKISVNIYSSGSIQAQKLLFGSSTEGDLTGYLDYYFDTTLGPKKEAASYGAIAQSLGVHPSQICFVSDAEAELVAAKDAGIEHAVMSIRPGNVPITSVGKSFPAVHSLMQLCGS